MSIRIIAFLILFFSPAVTFAAEIMFEGYYRIELNKKHIGYSIVRYEFDPKSSTFQAITFQRIKIGDKVMQESLKATANDKLDPISYQSTSQVGESLKAIDASFKGEIMKLKISDGKKVREETYKNPKLTILSAFLPYKLMREELKPETKPFSYSAVAEEDGGSYDGRAMTKSRVQKGSYEVVTIVNSYKKEDFYSTMAVVPDPSDKNKSIKGEVLGTESPVKKISVRLVASPSEATADQVVPNKILVNLFGVMPTGKVNLVATPPQNTASEPAAGTTPPEDP